MLVLKNTENTAMLKPCCIYTSYTGGIHYALPTHHEHKHSPLTTHIGGQHIHSPNIHE
jgi:hypothetical protein